MASSLGRARLADAAKNAFLKDLAWGGLKAGTKFGEPAPLFPRAEKDAIERMQNLEDENKPERGGSGERRKRQRTKQKRAALSKHETAAAAGEASFGDRPVCSLRAARPVPRRWQRRLNRRQLRLPAAPDCAAKLAAEVCAAGAAQHITIDDFAKVDLRVAQILVAERVPKADKLLRLEVDLGYEKRQILAGIAQYYEPEKLIGRKIVIVANLAPRKMRGLESNGMLLAASLEGGAPVLAGFLEDVPLGARLK